MFFQAYPKQTKKKYCPNCFYENDNHKLVEKDCVCGVIIDEYGISYAYLCEICGDIFQDGGGTRGNPFYLLNDLREFEKP